MAGFTYKSYSFTDKDPIIDEIRTIYSASGVNYAWLHEHSGVTPQTLASWFSGKTKKPQAATINAVLRSLGYKLAPVEMKQAELTSSQQRIIKFDPPLPQGSSKARPLRHIVQMAKYKGGRHG